MTVSLYPSFTNQSLQLNHQSKPNDLGAFTHDLSNLFINCSQHLLPTAHSLIAALLQDPDAPALWSKPTLIWLPVDFQIHFPLSAQTHGPPATPGNRRSHTLTPLCSLPQVAEQWPEGLFWSG